MKCPICAGALVSRRLPYLIGVPGEVMRDSNGIVHNVRETGLTVLVWFCDDCDHVQMIPGERPQATQGLQ